VEEIKMSTAEELLRWLDDDIYIPFAATNTQAVAALPVRDPVIVVGRSLDHRRLLVIENAGDSDNDSHELESPQLTSTGTQALYEAEREKRFQLEMDANCELNCQFATLFHVVALHRSKLEKTSTMTHNRNLIAQDLIKELVEANQNQRSELKQVLGVFQALRTPNIARPTRSR
jgi:hypothetical protein